MRCSAKYATLPIDLRKWLDIRPSLLTVRGARRKTFAHLGKHFDRTFELARGRGRRGVGVIFANRGGNRVRYCFVRESRKNLA
jgi:hypothetical protein